MYTSLLEFWILIALSTVVFPESTITGLNITGYAIGKHQYEQSTAEIFYCHHMCGWLNIWFPCFAALCGVVMYNYLKVKDVRAITGFSGKHLIRMQ